MNTIHHFTIACPVCAAASVLPVMESQRAECAECRAVAYVSWTPDDPDYLSIFWNTPDFRFAPQPEAGTHEKS